MFKIAEYADPKRVNWLTFSVIALFHAISVLSIFYFSWEGLAAFVILSLLTGSIGISFAYHRLLTHQGFKTNKFIAYLSTIFACMALEGGPIFWVATHRFHHKESDQPLDPHSPTVSFLWAHMLWLFYNHPVLNTKADRARLAPDLQRDAGFRFLEDYNFPIALATLIALFVGGYLYDGLYMGLSLLLWGGFLRTVYVWHVTWLINSATHMWGYRNYASGDDSTNCWWIALLSFGEGWHNNHHGQARSANFGHRWFEFDSTWVVIRALETVGLVHHVVRPKPAMETTDDGIDELIQQPKKKAAAV